MLNFNVKDQVVVVAGAGGRLGIRLIKAFVEQGARIAAIAHSEEAAQRVKLPGESVFIADLAKEAEAERCFAEIRAGFGAVDVLIHSVGTWSMKPLLETSLEDWETLMQVNLTSAFLCFREAARAMQGRGGRLIGFAAGQGVDQARAQQGAYAVSKAGVARLAEAVAAEYAGRGITAHAIAPSTILYEGEEEGQRGVRAEDLVDLCLYLCSGAGDALNGKTIRAYGSAG
jgi:3-oxoacyl-[acyl-carrier protein] reductase